MVLAPSQIPIYHITRIDNLTSIIAMGRILSDAAMIQAGGTTHKIGDVDIKRRRLREVRTDCPPHRFVGEFVPFYYCPRSPMLYRINKGGTGLPAGCQKDIVHLTSTVEAGMNCGNDWVIADGNASARHAAFTNEITGLNDLNWQAIHENWWTSVVHHKQAEFLVADFFHWEHIFNIGCYNEHSAQQVANLLGNYGNGPRIIVKPEWYY